MARVILIAAFAGGPAPSRFAPHPCPRQALPAPPSNPEVDDPSPRCSIRAGARASRRDFHRLAAGPLTEDGAEVEFPVELAIELAAVCNLACVMCPVPTTRRPKQLIDDDLFRRVVDQATGERGFMLLPQGFGESMLHKRWHQLLAHAVERGVRPIVLLTNGTLLDDANVARVLDLEIDAVVVSIDGVTAPTYAAVRVGGDLDQVEAGVRRLLAARGDRRRPKVCLRIIRMRETEREIESFFARWAPLLRADDELRINEYNDWAGKVADHSAAGHQSAPVGARPRPLSHAVAQPVGARRRQGVGLLPRQRGRADRGRSRRPARRCRTIWRGAGAAATAPVAPRRPHRRAADLPGVPQLVLTPA